MKDYLIQLLASLTYAFIDKNYEKIKSKIRCLFIGFNFRLALTIDLSVLDVIFYLYLLIKGIINGWDSRDYYLTLSVLFVSVFSAIAYYYSKYSESRYIS